MAKHRRNFFPLLFSLLVHGLVLGIFVWNSRKQDAVEEKKNWIEVTLDESSIKKRQDDSVKRIVESQMENSRKEESKDAFLSAHTQTVKKQSSGKLSRAGSKTPTLAPMPKQPKPQLKDLGLTLARPQADDLAHDRYVKGDQVASDYVEDVAQSDRTLLNTKEFVFFSYFQRVREQLDNAWRPILREHVLRVYKSGRKIASNRNLRTQLLVTLNKGGEVTKVQVLEESGVLDLDDAAVKAFNKAGPFPNPPTGLVTKKNSFDLRWDFILRS